MTHIDDLTLARAKEGDRAALATVLEAHKATVYSVVSRMLVKNQAAVDDLAQEVFIKVIRFLPRFRGNGAASLPSWIAKMAARTCLDFLRASNRPEPIPFSAIDERESTEATPEESASQRELEERVQTAMSALPADLRAALILRAFHDCDYLDIADALGVEVGTVKSRLSRARQALRGTVATGIVHHG